MKSSGEKCSRLLIVLFTCVGFLITSPIVHAATGDIVAVRIVGATTTVASANSACNATSSCNGWVAEIDIAGLNASGTYSFGLGTNNDPTNAKIVLTVTSLGFTATGATTTVQRTIYGTDWVRQPYPNATLADEATSTGIVTVRVSLSDFIYQKDTNITATIASGFYTQGGTPNNAAASIAVTNNSVLSYPKTIANWSYPGWTRITGSSFTVRAVAFNRSAQQGLPVRVVKFTATDQHSHSVSTLVTLPTVDNSLGDASKIVEYIGTLPTASFTAKDLITINFAAYPWVGDTGAVMDTSDGVNSQPTPLYAPIYGIYDDGTYGTAAAVVDASVGNDSTCAAVAESSFSSSSPPTACLTINKAAAIINAYNNTNYSRNDAAGTIYLKAGNYNWTGSSTAISATASNAWNIVTPFPGVSSSSVVINGQSGGQAFGGTKIKLENLTINVTSSPVSLFNGIDYLWLDHCSLVSNGTAPIYQVKIYYITDGSLGALTNGLRNFGGVQSSPALVRGNNLIGLGTATVFTVLGNSNSALGIQTWANETSGQFVSSTAPIFSFNTMYRMTPNSGNAILSLDQTTSNGIGAAVVQNLFENNYTDEVSAMWGVSSDGSTASPVNNVMLWYNTTVGGRINRGYNETGSTVRYRSLWSEVGELTDLDAIKTDTFGAPTSTRIGNWAVLYGVGRRGSYTAEVSGGSTGFTAAGDFQLEFDGLSSYAPTKTLLGNQPILSQTNSVGVIGYVNRQAFDGTSANSGGGNYELTGSSPAIAMVPGALAALPYDLAGNARHTSSAGAAGAYEYVDTTPPSVTWVSPSNGTTVSSTITLTASSTDNVAVSSVTFYANGSVVGSSTIPSGTQYSISWDSTTVANGSTTLMALATDSSNNTSSVSVTVNVQNPAILRITTSTSLSFTAAHGSTATSSQAITVKNAGASGSTLTWSATSTQPWLTFSPGSSSLASNATTSVLFIVNPTALALGTYNATTTISAVSASSSPQLLSINLMISATGISTSITSPTNGGTVSGVTTVTATATSTAGISSVQFFLDGSPLGSAVTSSPYSVSWNTALAANGSHVLSASTTDALLNIATSSPITVTVNNGTGSAPASIVVTVPYGNGNPNYQTPGNTPPPSLSFSSSTPSSTSDLQALINSLTAQLRSLLAQAGQGSGASPRVFFVRNLSLRVTGNDVGDLQQFLINEASGPAATALKAHGATTVFGMLTDNALKEFQKKVGIVPASGYFGPKTRAYVNAIEEESTATNHV